MNLRIKTSLILFIYAVSVYLLTFLVAGIDYIFELKIKGNVELIFHSVHASLALAIILLQPKIIFFMIAVAIPLATAIIGEINGKEIWKEWYYWLLTAVCVTYMAWYLLTSIDKRTNQA